MENIVKCPNCGIESTGLKFCGECCTPLKSQQPIQAEQQQYVPPVQKPQTWTVTVAAESSLLTDLLAFTPSVVINGVDYGKIKGGRAVSTTVGTDVIDVILKGGLLVTTQARFKITGPNPYIRFKKQLGFVADKLIFVNITDAYMI